jgi:autotransporter-associated beta strand protein
VGGFIKTGEGVLRFHGPDPNTHTGTNRVEAGELQLYRFLGGQDVISIPGPLIVGDGFGGAGADVVIYGGPGEITDTAPVAIQSSGLVRLQSWSDTIGSLSGSGSLMLDSGRLALGGDNGSATFSGVISGTGPLTKVGIGAQTLSGNNTYLGQTSVSNGTLIVNGQQPSSPVFVYDGGTLGGNGTVQRINVLGGGRLSPGTSPGILSAGGIVNFQDATATYLVELNGLTAGADYDQLNAPFGVALGNAALQVTLGFAPAPGASFVILNKGGAAQVVGTFDGLPEGATFPAGGLLFQITYAGGDGNDVVLTRVAAAASQIQGLASLPDGSKEIQGLGAPGLAYTLEAATNLSAPVLWLPLGTVTADGAGAYQFIDADAPLHPMRFYRVLSP